MPLITPEGAWVAPVPHPILATEAVRYVGQPIAAVVAPSLAEALDAAELIEPSYDSLPPVTTVEQALEGSVRLHAALEDNVILRWKRTGGDVDGAFTAARHVVRSHFHIPRLIAAPIEPRGAVAIYDAGTDLLTIWCSAQDPHPPRAQVSHVLGRPEDRIRVIVPDVGGAFGSKGALPPEVALAAILSIQLRVPVKWVEDRRENLLAAYQGRGLDADVEMAVDENGRILGVRARLVADYGAYLLLPLVPITVGMLLTGSYAIPNAAVELTGVATNKVATGPYRGAGRPEAAYIVERMIDLIARQLKADPIEIRRRNFIPAERFPYRTPLGFVYDSGNYPRTLDRALVLAEVPRWRAEQTRARTQGRYLGIGVACYVERAAGQVWERVAVVVGPSGRVVIRPGTNPHGQGHETTFAQIAADALRIDPSAVVFEAGDSAVVPRGVGTFGSRSTTVGGSALTVALDKIKTKMTKIAAHLLEASEADIEWEEGRIHVRGASERGIAFQDVAAAAYQPPRLPQGMEVGLDVVGSFTMRGPVFPFGTYVAVVEVSPETGGVAILTLVAVDDAGRIVNPLLAEGQVIGAAIQGLGQALVEEGVYADDGQPLTTTFAEYGLIRAKDAPSIRTAFMETPSPFNPLGAKGIGEAGAIATPAAVANAVLDAMAPTSVSHLDFPLSPERLWRAYSHHPRGGDGSRSGGE
jgi:carbon-monoxide dehydrogenase large subunit